MKRAFGILSVALLAVGCANAPQPAFAGEQPNILIMGEDGDKDTVPRNSRVFKRVLGAISNQLQYKGFKVYDETAVSLKNFSQGRTRRTDAEIFDIAKSITNPPVDVPVTFSIYASAKTNSYTTKVKIRITGRALNVRSGRRLGNFEVKLPQDANAPVACNRECILETVGDNARELGNDLGAVLAKILDQWSPTSGAGNVTSGGTGDAGKKGMSHSYSIKFSEFSQKEVSSIEEYLVAFKGYEHHRPVKVMDQTQEYWYETNSDSHRLNRNLREMLRHLGVDGRVTFAGNSFTVQKIPGRPNQR